MLTPKQPKDAAEVLELDKGLCKTDPFYFADKLLGFKPRGSQRQVIEEREQWNTITAGRRWGKDTLVINCRVIPLIFTTPNLQVGVYGPGWDECRVFMEMLYNSIRGTPLEASIIKNNLFDLELSNHARVLCRVASKLSTGKRGRGFDFLYFTESAFIPDSDIAICRATGIGRNAEEWHTSQPNGKNHFWRSHKSQYYKSWQFASTDNPMVTDREMERERSLCTDIEFRSLWLGEFLDYLDSVFPQELIEKAKRNPPEHLDAALEGERYYAGGDLGRRRDKSTVYIIRERLPHADVVYYKEFNYHKDDPVFWTKILNHFVFLCSEFNISRFRIDQTGIGDKFVLDMKIAIAEKEIQTSIEGVDFTYAVKNKWEGLLNQLLLRFERFQIHFPHIKQLVTQLQSISFEPTSKLFKAEGPSPDHVMALALAVSAMPYSEVSNYSTSAHTSYSPWEGFNALDPAELIEKKQVSGYVPKMGEQMQLPSPDEDSDDSDVI